MSSDASPDPPEPPRPAEPDGRRTIAVEVLIYALLFLLVGGAIVALQVARKGDGLLHFDPHGQRR